MAPDVAERGRLPDGGAAAAGPDVAATPATCVTQVTPTTPTTPTTPATREPPISLGRELARKALHLTTAVVPLAYAEGAPRPLLLAGLATLAGLALAVELARARHAAVRAVFTGVTGALLREHEHARWAGATWLLAAFLLAVALLPRDVAIAAMLAVSLGDAAGAIAGRSWSHWRAARLPAPAAETGVSTAPVIGLASAPKTWVGSAACLVAAAAGARVVAGLDPVTSVLAGLLAAGAERPRAPLDDNLRIVIVTGAGILLWRLAFS